MNKDGYWLKSVSFYLIFLLITSTCNILPATNSEETEPINPDDIDTMIWQGSNYLWISANGVARWDISSKKLEIFHEINHCNRLLTVTYAPETIWCNTSKYDGTAWQHFDSGVRKIVQTNDGTIWGCSNQGLKQFNTKQQKWNLIAKTTPRNDPWIATAGPGVRACFPSSDDTIWFISSDDPYHGTTHWLGISHQTYKLDEWGNSLMVPELEASDGTIWGGGNDGLVGRWDGNKWQTWHITFEVSSPGIEEILEAKDGSIWVRAVVDGVARWDGHNWQTWGRTEGLGNSAKKSRLRPTSMILTEDDNVWVGTAGEGISRWDGNRWHNYTMADGLSSVSISVLTESPDGVLWAGTQGGGLNFYDPETDQWQPFP